MDSLPEFYLKVMTDCLTNDEQPEPEQPEPEKPDQPEKPEYSFQETHKLEWQEVHKRGFVWLPHTGGYYGGKIKLVFNNGCGELIVNDATDNLNHSTGPLYFCGTKNKPEESNGYRASVFAKTWCRATSVTIFFNR